jgi:hypothetical protein
MSPRPPRGEVSNRGRASRKAAEKAWGKELGVAERRGARRVRDRLLAVRDEHHTIIDGIEYVEWSLIATALEEEVRPAVDPTARRPPGDGEAPAPTATAE